MLPGPLPARPSDRILARTEARGCSKGQREQRFHFALIKFLFLPFCDLLFPTSIIHSCKVNDATGPAWDGDGGGSMKTPGWAVTFCRPQNFPRAFGSMQPSAVLHPRGNRVGSICPGFFFCTAMAGKARLVRGISFLQERKILWRFMLGSAEGV